MALNAISILTVVSLIFAFGNAKRCPTDIVYLVDQSTSITRHAYTEQVLPILKNTIKELDIHEQGDHVSLIRFSSPEETGTEFHFEYDTSKITDSVSNLGYDGGNTATVQAMDIAHTNFFTGSASRTDGYVKKEVAPVVVLVTDGVATDGDAAAKAKELMEKGVQVFAIGVGPLITKDYLEQITGDKSRVFTDQDATQFNAALIQAIEKSTTCA